MMVLVLIIITLIIIALISKLKEDNLKIKKLEEKIGILESLPNPKIQELEGKIQELNSLLKPEQRDILKIKEELENLTDQKTNLLNDISRNSKELGNLRSEIFAKKGEIVELDDKISLQEIGIYEPKYEFVNSEAYKAKLQTIRDKQKKLIKANKAVHGANIWNINGNRFKGKKLLNDIKKLVLRAFNNECDDVISKAKYNKFEIAQKRIFSSHTTISKLGSLMDIYIEADYIDLKIEELRLAIEYQIKKQEEKELQAELREQMREERKIQLEIERNRQKLEKEQHHYLNFLKQVKEQINQTINDKEKQELLNKQNKINAKLANIDKSMKDIDYREANQKAGYVYIISNIGSFGENIYKIGMTRRLNPDERIYELGDASVPFRFDTHAKIFSEDAPKLEAALHKAFEDKKVNMVNRRREFFNVTLDEIKKVVKDNFDKTVLFIDTPEADEYRQSKKIKEKNLVDIQ